MNDSDLLIIACVFLGWSFAAGWDNLKGFTFALIAVAVTAYMFK